MIYPNKYDNWGEDFKEYDDSNSNYHDYILSRLKSTPKSETPNLEENSSHLVKINDLVYMVEIILKVNSCVRVRFLETVPPKFKPNSINGEVWISISDLYFLEKLDKNTVRAIKINSIVSDNE